MACGAHGRGSDDNMLRFCLNHYIFINAIAETRSIPFQIYNAFIKHFQLFIFTGFCVGLGCLAIAITSIFLDNITLPQTPRASMSSTLKFVLGHIARSRTQQLLIIPTVFRGFNLGFIMVDFTVVSNVSQSMLQSFFKFSSLNLSL